MADDKISKKRFSIELDVSKFHADELKVNVHGGELVVCGRHEEREEHGGVVERGFVRKYKLPKSVVEEQVTSELGADGILRVTVPTDEAADWRRIPIKVDPNWKMKSNPCQEVMIREPIPLWWW